MTIRKSAAILFAFAVTAPAAASQPDAGGQRLRMSAITTRQAVDEFARICLFDPSRLAQAHRVISRSSFGYVAGNGATDEQWRSNRAVVGLNKNANGRIERCNLDAVLSDGASAEEVVRLIGTRVALKYGNIRGQTIGSSVEWEWADDHGEHVLTIDFTGTARQFSASFANGRQRST